MTAPDKLLYGAGLAFLVAGLAITAGPAGSIAGVFAPSGSAELGQDTADKQGSGDTRTATPASPPADDGDSTASTADDPEESGGGTESDAEGDAEEDDGIEVGVGLL